MKTRKQKISRSSEILKLNSAVRERIMEHLYEMPEYMSAIERGLRFFTKDELDAIKSKYGKDGMTWDEIESEMSSKGTMLKHSTFRKYIQDNIIPKAKGYRSTTKGRVAEYNSNIIKHLNFVNFFYKVQPADRPLIEGFMDIVKNCVISYWDAIESNIDSEEANYGYYNLYTHLAKEIVIGYDDVTQSIIEDTLYSQEDKVKVLEMLTNIKCKFKKYIEKDLNKLIKYLENTKINASDIPNISKICK